MSEPQDSSPKKGTRIQPQNRRSCYGPRAHKRFVKGTRNPGVQPRGCNPETQASPPVPALHGGVPTLGRVLGQQGGARKPTSFYLVLEVVIALLGSQTRSRWHCPGGCNSLTKPANMFDCCKLVPVFSREKTLHDDAMAGVFVRMLIIRRQHGRMECCAISLQLQTPAPTWRPKTLKHKLLMCVQSFVSASRTRVLAIREFIIKVCT